LSKQQRLWLVVKRAIGVLVAGLDDFFGITKSTTDK
jgi:hypothetical protein